MSSGRTPGIKKIVKIKDIKDNDSITEDLQFWLRMPPEERVATVDLLRRHYHGSTGRLQRVAKVIQLTHS